MERISKLNIFISWIGAIVGVITAYLRPFSSNTFWSISDIVNCGGFWVTSICVIIYFSRERLQAGVNSLLYLLFMNLTYYLSLYFTLDIFYLKEFIFWCFASVICFFMAQIVFEGKENDRYSSLINALYQSVLVLETISLFIVFINWKTHFLQLSFNIISIIVLYLLYNQTFEKRKYTAIITIAIVITFKLSLLFINSLGLGI